MRKAAILMACLLAAVIFTGCAGEDTSALLSEIQEDNIQKETGAYIGLVENNSFELQIEENTYKVFLLTEKTRQVFEKMKLQMGDKITIDYSRNKSGQLETLNIERINESKDVKGKYVGLADNNFFEVTVKSGDKEESKVFMLTDKVKSAFDKLKLKKNDTVSINYTENKQGQLVVNTIKKSK